MDIAELNSYGNFTCSEWVKDGIVIGNEEGLVGRSKLVLSEIENKLKQKYTTEEIKNKTILDVGCYDGFYLTYLSNLGFKKITGLEPKEKNILKGKVIRKFLKIPEPNINWIHGDLSKLNHEKYDIVLCLGVLHHVTDHFSFLKSLTKFTSENLFIDCRVTPDKIINKNLFLEKTEMLDVIYKFKKPQIAISSHKYESSFNDTSTSKTGIVSIPNKKSIELFLESIDFKTNVLVGPVEYRKKLNHNRDLDGLLIHSEPIKNKKKYSLTYAIEYERKLFKTLFSKNLISSFLSFHNGNTKFYNFFKKNYLMYYFLKNKKFHKFFDFFFKKTIQQKPNRNIKKSSLQF